MFKKLLILIVLPALIFIIPALTIYIFLTKFGLSGNLAQLIAGVPVAIGTGILSRPEIWNQFRGTQRRTKVERKSFDNYRLNDPFVFLFSVGILIFVSVVASNISGRLWAFMGWDFVDLYVPSLGILLNPPDFVVMESISVFCLGYWVGLRARHYPQAIIIGGILISSLFSLLADFSIGGLDIATIAIGVELTFGDFVMTAAFFTMINFLVGAIGVAMGRRNQHARYLKIILSGQSKEVKDSIIFSVFNSVYGQENDK